MFQSSLFTKETLVYSDSEKSKFIYHFFSEKGKKKLWILYCFKSTLFIIEHIIIISHWRPPVSKSSQHPSASSRRSEPSKSTPTVAKGESPARTTDINNAVSYEGKGDDAPTVGKSSPAPVEDPAVDDTTGDEEMKEPGSVEESQDAASVDEDAKNEVRPNTNIRKITNLMELPVIQGSNYGNAQYINLQCSTN